MPKREFSTTDDILDVLHTLWSGKRVSSKWIQGEYGVQASAANKWLRFIRKRYGAHLEAHAEGRSSSYAWRGTAPTVAKTPMLAALAIEFGSTSLAAFEGTKIHTALRELGEPVREKVSNELMDRLARVSQVFCRRSTLAIGPRRATVLDQLIEALEGRHSCRFEYEKVGGSRGRYEVEPWRLIEYRGGLYLYAGKLPGRDERLFDVDGLSRITINKQQTFVPPASQDVAIERLFRHSVGIYMSRDSAVDVVLRVSPSAAARLRRRPWHSSQRMRELLSGHFEVTLFVKPCPELVSMVLAHMPDVVVRAPDDLAQKVLQRAQAYIRAATS